MKVLQGAVWLQSHASLFVKSRHGKKPSMARGSGGETGEETGTDKQ